MNILVLGGNGFIGSHVVDNLLERGHKVRVFDRSSEHYRAPLSQVEYRLGHFDDTLQLAEALHGVDAVCHLISTTVPSTSNLDVVNDVESNLVNTLHLLEQMRKNNVHRMLYLSSGGAVYGNADSTPVSENDPLNPISSYGVVKLAIEKYLFMYQQLYGLQPIVLRPSNPYGPRQGHAGVQGLIGTLLAKSLAGETLEIWGDGGVIRDYVYVADLAELCVKSLESDVCGVFNSGSGVGYSINDILLMLQEVINEPLQVKYSEGRSCDVKKIILDITHAMQKFDWQPSVSLHDGIRNHMEWLRSL